ncbi:filament-like plant protein 7 [Dorcoceras hygrometricum]|uniref:Filament-like plant protein 7 n=1 Tax=Dorcoceras hygrometricum TaxID=472368 RepID=A0A2Z7AMB2_9LAMI|nr:filament-like plant protein 7 [Dorcoceras hygrometricum]
MQIAADSPNSSELYRAEQSSTKQIRERTSYRELCRGSGQGPTRRNSVADQARAEERAIESQKRKEPYVMAEDQIYRHKIKDISNAGGNDMLAAGFPVVGRVKLATGLPNDWFDQTMSYQLIQTTSFAMHPRLVKYNAEALVWMYCSCLLHLLVNIGFLLLVMSLLMTSSTLSAPAELSSSADCDDITADVIIADSRSCASLHLLIMISSLMKSSSMVHLDVPAGSLLMFQLVHLPLLALAAGSLLFQLIHLAPAGSTWPPPDYEQLIQLWMSPLLIQLPSK